MTDLFDPTGQPVDESDVDDDLETTITILVDPAFDGARLDRFIAESESVSLSRSRVLKLIEGGEVAVNGAMVTKGSTKVKTGESVTIVIPAPIPLDVTAETIPLTILYEDDDVIVVDKPAGMVTHPSAGHLSGTLVNAILSHCRDTLSGVGGVMRPGIVHRLDRDTSGAIIIAKNDLAHEHLAAQLKSRKLTRTYVAVVKGRVKTPEGIIDAPIGRSHADRKKMGVREDGREAVSLYKVTQEVNKASVVEVSLKTGRTHQIRVHMLHLGYPVAGDAVYGRKAGGFHIKRQALHAWRLTFVHPRTGAEVTVTAPLPNDMVALIKSLGGDPAFYL